MQNSNKQEQWATDIRIRMALLLNGFEEKCNFGGKVDRLIEN